MDANRVLEIFKEITTIPRESGHEEPMTAFLQQFAASHGLGCKTDPTGNVLITKSAAPGKEKVPTLVLQAHQDMVCEKNAGVKHDFAKDPIKYVIRDGWMIAEDTTLGADDGIGIAACLALLESDCRCGKIECLFTISEETGMDGAENLREGFFEGKTLINLDSEDEGQLFIGCAGGVNTEARISFPTEPVPEAMRLVRLDISGCMGGHSGDDINKERINAVQQMARFIYRYRKGLRLVSFIGGGKPNAIARECTAIVATGDPDTLMKDFAVFGTMLGSEYHVTDPDVTTGSELSDSEWGALSFEDTEKLTAALVACPHGVYAMSQDIEGLVETSSNLASVKMPEEGSFVIRTSQRSSTMSEREFMAGRVSATFRLIGAEVEHLLPYPGWKPNMDSKILKVCADSYRRLFAQEPEIKAIHAGLECGLFLDKFPGLDMISFGPTLRGVHAPGEKMELASLVKFTALLEDVVCKFE